MKKQLISKLLLLTFVIFGLTLSACDDDDSSTGTKTVDPANSNALTDVLQIPNASKVNGALPSPTTTGTGLPTATQLVSAYETAAGTQMELYLDYNAPQGLGGVYVAVDGATKYFNIPNPVSTSAMVMAGTTSGQIVIPIVIPSNVIPGNFGFSYVIYDANGRVSNVIQTSVVIGQVQSCSTQSASGGEGITIRNFNMGSASGNVSIDWDTYSVPDRIDVYQNGVWKAGTGTNPGTGYPPLLTCQQVYDVGQGYQGYIGDYDTFVIPYSPAQGQIITVRVSGCTGGGTAWNFNIGCPQ